MKRCFLLITLIFMALMSFAEEYKGGMYVNATDGLKVRNEPNLSSKKITRLDYGEYVYAVKSGETVKIDGITAPWVQIELDEELFWVFGGYLSKECPMTEAQLITYLSDHDPIDADYFPMEDGVNYIRQYSDTWEKESAEYSYALENLCSEFFSNEKKETVAIHDCLFLRDGAAASRETLVFVEAGSEVSIDGVVGYGIKDGILFPIYSGSVYANDRYVHGQIRGIDITDSSCISKASNGSGGNITLMYQRMLKNISSSRFGNSKADIEAVLSDYSTYEGAWLKGGYELLNVSLISSNEFYYDIPVSSFSEYSFGTLTIEYPLNMTNPVPFVVVNWFSGGFGGGDFGKEIYTLELINGRAILNFVTDYEYLNTDGGPVGMGYHYFTNDGLCTYVYQEEYGDVQQNMTNIYTQKKSAPYTLNLTSSFRNEPDGRSKTFKSGQYVNPIFRLKMRTSPSLNADKINTISPGTLLQIIELGPKTTIDGYTSNWVKVKSVNEAYFLEGSKFDKTGWVFGAYLE